MSEKLQIMNLPDPMVNKNTTFHGNPLLKSAREQVALTKEHIEELRKCMNDPVYFAEKYIKIVNIDTGLQNIKLYPYQKRLLKGLHENRQSIILSCRQSGKTTVTCAYILHFILFNEDKEVCLLANKGAQAREIMSRIQLAYTHLPKWLQSGVTSYNKSSIELENGCKLVAAATSSDSVRGRSFACVFIDECAFIQKNVWDKFWVSTFPTISSGKNSKLIIVSTPNGRNHFYDFWKNAQDGKSDMCPMEVNWWDVPGRDEEWRKNILKTMTQEQFNVEYGNSFDASSDTLISPDMFARLERNIQQPIQATKVMRIYEPPQEGHQYIATVDCADVGTDFSTISVIDITEYPWKQVAVYGDDSISHLSLPQIIVNICTKYNMADVLVESNDIGNTVLYILNYDKEYENIIKTFDKSGKPVIGQKTTSKTKGVGCARFKDMIETEKLIVHDHKTFGELRHFCLSGTSYEAEEGYHDDFIMGLVNLSYYASTPQFKSKYDSNFSDEFQREFDEKIMEELMPLPIFSSRLGADSEDISWLQ